MLTVIYCRNNHKRLSRLGKQIYVIAAAIILLCMGYFMILNHEAFASFVGSRGLADNMIMWVLFGALGAIVWLSKLNEEDPE